MWDEFLCGERLGPLLVDPTRFSLFVCLVILYNCGIIIIIIII